MAYAWKELEQLLDKQKKDVSLLRAFLGDTMKQKLQAEWSRDLDLKRQIKELIYDVEDLHAQSLLIKIRGTTSGRGKLDKVGYTVESEIESMNGRLDPMLRMIQSYKDLQFVEKQPSKGNEVTSVQLNKEVPPIRQNNVVGFEKEAEILIKYLREDTKEVDVLSITGMPGIGKTTLAWKIYQNEMIKLEFPSRIWVDIPLDFSNKDLYVYILKEFIKQGIIGYPELLSWLDIHRESCSKDSYLDIFNEYTEGGRISDRQLIHAVRACLEKKKFLLVLDGVQTADTFESIRCFLPNKCKVLITSCMTRINHLTRKPHVLRFLDEDESWKLLQLEVFGKFNACPEMLTSTGKSIAKTCDGLPLAILAVASSLVVASSTVEAKYLNEQRWKKVSSSENVLAHLAVYDQRRVFTSVELTYITLTPCLQDCLLYLGVFPEGQEISVPTLIRLWIAERLVQYSERLTFEESAEQILDELIDGNLVMVGKMYPNGQIKTCRLHTLIYGFCKFKAAEKDFYHDIRESRGGGGALDRPISLTPNHLRLCIYSHFSEFLSSGENGECIRSILCHNKEDQVLHPKHSSSFHKYFKLLRILDCKYARFNKFPTKLSNLIHLKYISLSCDDLRAIPDTISSLLYLETLVVNTQSPSLELKANIWRMFQLRHLVTKAAIVLAIQGGRGDEAGGNLQTLTRLAPECCTEDVFARVPNLKRLGIRGQLAALSISADSMRNLCCLQHLKLMNESGSATDQLHRFLIGPGSGCFPPNLKSLTLSGTNMEWGWMSALGKIHSLEILKFKNIAFTGGSWSSTDADDFGRLGFLLIGTTNLVSWEASVDCFPNLKYLVLKNCEKIEKLPLTLAKSLDTLDSESVSQSAMEIEEQGQQKDKLHVFKLSIR